MSQSFLYTWLEWVYSNHLIPSAPPCSVFNDSLVPLNKVHTNDCCLRSSTVWLRPSLLHLYLMLPVYGPHVQKEETFTSHIVFPCLLWLLSHISRPRMCCVCSGGATLWDPMDCSPPDSSVHRIFQARLLEWVTISSSRRSSWSRDQTPVSYFGKQILYCWAIRKASWLECLLQFLLL